MRNGFSQQHFSKQPLQSGAGFTLIETLVVGAIVIVVSVAGFLGLAQYRNKQVLGSGLNELRAAVEGTKRRSVAQEEGSRWGIRFTNATSGTSSYSVFRGTSYSTSGLDRTYSFRGALGFGNPSTSSTYDLVFSPLSGALSENKVVTLVGGSKGFIGDLILRAVGSITARQDYNVVGYWHLDEGTSTSAYDASGYGNTGMLTTGPTWQSGSSCKAGSCLSFDGADDYVILPSVNPTAAITVTAWIKSNSSSGYSGAWQLISKYSAYILGTGSTGGKNINFIVYTNNSWRYGTYYTVSDPQNWHFFAGVYDSATQLKKLYMDGVQRTSDTVTSTINADTGPIHLAHRESVGVGVDHFGGVIDEVRIYDRALSATEIEALYNNLE
ncbi:MAG: LamG-like jellyroll fold domain-containing protein [Candidatus Brennerbacteria bacterium]